MDMPCAEMGSQMVMMRLDCINDKLDRCDEIAIKLELVIRDSTVMKELANY
jgi:DNA-binding LacI/PurR family transcriptional regulator